MNKSFSYSQSGSTFRLINQPIKIHLAQRTNLLKNVVTFHTSVIGIFFKNNQSCLSQKGVWSSGRCRKLRIFSASLSKYFQIRYKTRLVVMKMVIMSKMKTMISKSTLKERSEKVSGQLSIKTDSILLHSRKGFRYAPLSASGDSFSPKMQDRDLQIWTPGQIQPVTCFCE